LEIGIDIGTSYSSVAVLGENGVLPVKSDTGQCAYGNSYSIPSAVFAKKDGSLLIGQAAVASRMIAPSCFRDCFKRDFGSDTAFLLGDNEYTTDQLYIEFFKHFRQEAEKLTGMQVTKAYITHPANYTEYKKQKLRTAAAYAGLLDIQLIDEPTAAALSYYEKGTVKSGERLLVYDFGGGTFDLALVRATEDGFELMTSPLGLEHCGGVDFDMMIYEDIVNSLSAENDLSAANGNIQFRAMLSEQCIKIKHMLSYDDIATVAIPFGFTYLNYSIDREKYNRMIARQVMQTCDLINKITENAGIRVAEIDRTLCVGGTTRTPYILELLEKTIGKKVFQNADPELAICCGAAAYSTRKVHLNKKDESVNTPSNEKGSNTPGNINNLGLAVSYQDWVYYSNINDCCNLYKMHSDGSANTKLTDHGLRDINVIDGWIYFTDPDQMIHKFRLDGSEITQLNNDRSSFIHIIDNWIYYQNVNDSNKLYKVRTDGSQRTRINNDSSYYINIVDGWIYYTDSNDDKSYKIRTDGSCKTKLSDQEFFYTNVVDNWIYYTCNNKVYKVRVDGSNRMKLSNDDSFEINVVGDWIYYSNGSDSRKLYKIRTDGSQRTKLSDDDCSCINVVDNWIYYTDIEVDKLFRIQIDGTNRQLLSQEAKPESDSALDSESTASSGRLLYSSPTPHSVNTSSYEKGSNTQGNINNLGLAVSYRDWVYFSNLSDHWNLYKMHSDGSAKTKLSNLVFSDINIVNDWIYFTDGGEYMLNKVRLDGSQVTQLNSDESRDIHIADNWIYYRNESDSDKLYKVRTDGSQRTRINNDSSHDINIVDGWIYYTNWNDDKLYKLRTDGSCKTKVSDDFFINTNIVDNWIYYTCNDKIYKVRLDGSQRTKLNDDEIFYMNVAGDWIYYSNKSDSNKLYKIRTDGSKRTKLSDDYSRGINVVDNWIYYTNEKFTKFTRIQIDGTNRQSL
jgi:hypothetical protein